MMVCFKVLLFILFVSFITNMCTTMYFPASTRFTEFSRSMQEVKDAFNLSGAANFFMISLLMGVASANILGSIPGVTNSNMYYFLTCGMSLTVWLSIMVVTMVTQFREFISHMLPYGTPMALMFFLPLVEIFSNLIRPFTLMVRLSTNLSSGHIMLYMFSYFTIAAKSYIIMAVSISGLMFLLFSLEVFVSLLQAYIFSSLLALYYKESL